MKKSILVGRNPVLEGLRKGLPINKVLIQASSGPNPDSNAPTPGHMSRPLAEIYRLAQAQGIPVTKVKRQVLDRTAGGVGHQGVVAMVAASEYVEVEDLLEVAAARGEDPLIVILDHLEDPHNVGAILRTAEAVGAHGAVIPSRRGALLGPGVEKSSAGAINYIGVARVGNLTQAMQTLRKRGLWIIGTDANAALTYYQADLTGPLAVVIGSEGKGMSRLVRENCDLAVKIPMRGQVTSLNASVACGIVLYEVLRQRSLASR